MNKLYQKSEIWFSIAWIIAYCTLASIGDELSEYVGVSKIVTFPVLVIFSVCLILFLKNNQLFNKYGLCKSEVPASRMLFYIPLGILLTANLWYGFRLNATPVESVLYILSMFCVGFLEEMIFRGFLFHAMLKEGVKFAIVVSSVTFGIGHIVNLFNGSGAELLPNLLQVIYAIAAGFMFVMIYYRTRSLVPCIVTHGLFNALSVFANEADMTDQRRIIACVLITIITGAYALYLALMLENNIDNIYNKIDNTD